MELRDKVLKLRDLESISQQQLADMVGVSKGKIAKFEHGSSKVIGSDFLEGVAKHANLKKYAAWLVGIESTPPISSAFSESEMREMDKPQLELLKQLIDSALSSKQ